MNNKPEIPREDFINLGINIPNNVRHIINYLEGGIDSFNHKTFIYRDVTNLISNL